jgi:hypothetical protein
VTPEELQLLARTFGVSAFSWMFIHPLKVHTQLAPGQVQAVRTTLTKSQARAAILGGFRTTQGRDPSAAELSMLVAHSAYETGAWSAMWCWNFGNISTVNDPWFTLGKERLVAPHKYKPYVSALDGAAHYVSYVKRKCPAAWEVLGSGDTYAFAQALKSCSYYEGDYRKTDEQKIATYAAGLNQHYA